ncbi:MAG: hypothetical protein ACTSUE_12180 [Promethearchaeota archaeon]
MILLITMVFFIAFIILSALVLLPLHKEKSEHFNPISENFYYIVIILIACYAIKFLITWSYYPESPFKLGDMPVIGAYLKISLIFSLLIELFQFLFLLIVYGKRKYYSIPFLWFLFTAASNIETDAHIFIIISSIITSGSSVVLFLYKGIRNKNGLLLSYGIHVGLYFTGNLLMRGDYIYFIIPATLGFLVFNLGAWDVIDQHLFIDRKLEKKIKNAWINQVIQRIDTVKNKAPEQKLRPKRLHIVCPVCAKQDVRMIPVSEILKRQEKPQGIVELLVTDVCEHELVLYIDRNYTIRDILVDMITA